MTHDDITTRLRDPRPTMSIDAQATMLDAADRLDLYRTLLQRAEWWLPCLGMHEDVEVLRRDISEAIK